jgi:hypothetical protein
MIGGWKRKAASRDLTPERSSRNIEHGISFLQCNCQCTSNILSHLPFLLQVDSGFLEGIIRGYKAGILTQNQYANLTQCESLEGASNYHYISRRDSLLSFQISERSCLPQTMETF